MGYTHFSGPVTAGNIFHTTGTTPGVDVENVGQVVMAQSFPFTENGTPTTTDITLPAISQVLSINWTISTAFTNAVSVGGTLDGTVINATYFANATTPGLGVSILAPTTVAQCGNWVSAGVISPTQASDVRVVVSGGAVSGAGRGVLTVTYLQGPNGNT
jgi:hypothetical protein